MKVLMGILIISSMLLSGELYAQPADSISCPATPLTNCQVEGGPMDRCTGSYVNNGQKVSYTIAGGNISMMGGLPAGRFVTSGNGGTCLYVDLLYPIPAVGQIN